MITPFLRAVRVRAALCAMLACIAIACASNRTPERSFATLADAIAGGAFEPEWLPQPRMPPSARNIRVRRDLQSVELWARFEFDEPDRANLGRGCQRIGQQELRLPASQTRGIGWWPEMLRSDPGVAAQQFELHQCTDTAGGIARLAVHRSLTAAFYWRAKE